MTDPEIGSMPPTPDKVTIYEVARRAGVSIATVSHVLNRPERVSALTRGRVLDVVDELGFTPKNSAVALARKGVGRIGVVAPFTSYPSYSARLVGVLEACRNSNLDVVVFDVPSAAAATSPLLHSLPTTGRLDGLLIMGVPLEDSMARRLAQRKLHTVLIDSHHKDFASVTVDDEAGGYRIGRHLTDRGHQHFVFVSEPQESTDYVSAGQLRLRGFQRALDEGRPDSQPVHWVMTTPDLRGGEEAAAFISAMSERPDAVFGHHDVLAAGVLKGLRAGGIRVPEEIAVVGYDGSDLADGLDMTTVSQPFTETGRIGAGLLLQLLGGTGSAVQQITLAPELVVRSTA
ncbi:LacI family transcriptional regulator [Nakamurella sp. UYEF19]|uniref:LacI family DNA-binding transcriptional regulator n=1 Tax=Nakamurella sp. UYEF19 TaxID=1756392 RepID=UPI00339684A0